MSSGHRYEAVGDGNIGIDAQVIPPQQDTTNANDSVGYETSIPIHPKILAPLSYVLPVIGGLIIIILERRNTYVRLHAWQSVILSMIVALGSMLLFWVPFVPYLIHLASFVVFVVCIYHAWKDAETLTFFKLGVVGDFAERQVLGSTVLPF
ncbi:hypothetical protein GGI25_002983 [Coemansia spiralis]|uniref:Uncharacterized protein n=2 Tax=Coemansia TaxID=4863 RepID=A0A9W8G9M0_9FUNG|nr:hypothetical protein BX070DRAFT_228153 [Coemansia spiralis]KAJ1993095.1 hypothetical protein EDC05_002353 [Coemansia umbellata]KAJ2623789.1 hypothetical protein GGI26_002027 [Coemansia sp. RSA 1358]KAJ2677738.1 hypothetical protein GGI25_002983 [Coemansia spiralis]